MLPKMRFINNPLPRQHGYSTDHGQRSEIQDRMRRIRPALCNLLSILTLQVGCAAFARAEVASSSLVAPIRNQHSSPGTRDRLVQEVVAVRSIPANLLVHNAWPSDSSEVFAQAAGFFRKTRAERESGA
jgi:hypothetical protein